MPGILDTYAVADEGRGRWIKWVVLGALAVAVIGGSSYLYFRTWSQERTLKRFFATLDSQDFQSAYKMWCPPENPCKYNPFDRFERDWGPSTPYAHGSAAKVDNIDFCGDGVVFNVSYPNAEPLVLWVERSTNIISFAPSEWERCPGKHWQFRKFFNRLFSS